MKSAAAAETLSYTCPVEAHISFQMLNTRQCAGCGHESGRTEKYLNLSLVSKDSVSQGLLEYLKAEQLEYKCHCGASESWQRRSFSTLPNVLIVHLQRFEVTPFFTVKKTHEAVSLSTELLLSTNQSAEKIKYSLKSVVSHFGSGVKSGHYVCDGVYRNASPENGNTCWATYNDDLVQETTVSHVCQQRQTTAYLLFYQKQRKQESS
uniref:USP domain-containing protein n=1 Tax=Tetraodon nigroviridis TaxID=99883 RepID=H3BYI1_TETNG